MNTWALKTPAALLKADGVMLGTPGFECIGEPTVILHKAPSQSPGRGCWCGTQCKAPRNHGRMEL